MVLHIQIPKETEDRFVSAFGPDLSESAKEAMLIQGYRVGRISLGFIAEVMGLPTRMIAQEWLAARGVPLSYDLEELERDHETVQQILRAQN